MENINSTPALKEKLKIADLEIQNYVLKLEAKVTKLERQNMLLKDRIKVLKRNPEKWSQPKEEKGGDIKIIYRTHKKSP